MMDEWTWPGDDDRDDVVGTSRSISMEMTLYKIDPELLSLLTGQPVHGQRPATHHSVEMIYFLPVRRRAWRVVWEWLTRTPRQYTQHAVCIPRAIVSGNPSTTESEQT